MCPGTADCCDHASESNYTLLPTHMLLPEVIYGFFPHHVLLHQYNQHNTCAAFGLISSDKWNKTI